MSRQGLFIVFLLFELAVHVSGQAPQKMSFQAVVRDAAGNLVVNRPVGMRFSVLRGSPNGPVVFSETHKPTTNFNGLVSLEIGSGTPVSGFFAAINWSIGPYFVQTETDPNGGTAYTILGVSQLLSVPYALYAKTAENGDQIVTLAGSGATKVTGNYPNFTIHSPENNIPYTAGPGIFIDGTVIANTAPDQPISLVGAGATTVTGTYPNFAIASSDANTTYTAGPGIFIDGTVIANTAPDQPITLVGAGATAVTGTYPNFTITSTDANTTYTAGPGIFIDGTVIANTAPDQPITLVGTGATAVTGTYPNFIIISTDANTTYTAGAGIALDGTTIINVAPDQPITLTAGPGITVGGTYPNFTLSASSGRSVGEVFGGGIVFYVYDHGLHGLVASLTDLGTVSQWHTGFSNSGAINYYDGGANTALIIGTQGVGSYAAKICSDYMAGGFTDWYLPSLWELNLLFQNSAMISFKLANDGNPGTSPLNATGSYWSSTQFDNELAYMIYFPDGTPYLDYKNKSYRIRAVRRF